MKFWKRESKSMWIVVAALLLLLPLLAWLQYRWLGRLSDGDREQLKASLRITATRFGQDFDQELTLAYACFQPDPSVWAEAGLKKFAAGYERWMTTAQYPQMVSEIYLLKGDDNGRLSLKRFDTATGQTTDLPWPIEMNALRERLEQRYQGTLQFFNRPALPNEDAAAEEARRRLNQPVIADLPALVMPVYMPPVARENSELRLRPPSGYSLVTLNETYLRQEVLPALARRHFHGDEQATYDLAVINRNGDKKPIFLNDSSQAHFDPAFATSDVTVNFFGIRFEVLRTLRRNLEQAQPGASPEPAARPSFAGIPMQPPPSRFSPGDDSRIWQLVIKHRAGSVEAAVTGARRQNLLLSFGILLTLTVSIILMMLSARRAQQLAKQQIEFVAGVSHELRTPLAVIRSAGENLADGVIRDDQRIKSYGKLIRDEGRRLSDMVEQVLEFASTQSGKKQYELAPATVDGIIDRALSAVSAQLNDGGFEVEQHLPADLPMIMADAPSLERAVQNLLTNAMKYSGDSRWIGVNGSVSFTGSYPCVQLVVADRGLGIPADEMSHIFEPFYRGREVTAAQIHGNGLGLSLVKSIVEAHCGAIRVQSTPGQGTTFTISLPAMIETKEQRTAVASALRGETESRSPAI